LQHYYTGCLAAQCCLASVHVGCVSIERPQTDTTFHKIGITPCLLELFTLWNIFNVVSNCSSERWLCSLASCSMFFTNHDVNFHVLGQ